MTTLIPVTAPPKKVLLTAQGRVSGDIPMPTNDPTLLESPLTMVQGESYAFSITVPGAGTITGTPTNALYDEDNNDISSTYLSGSTSISGNVITTKVVGPTSAVAGQHLTLSTTAAVDGRTDIYLLEIDVLFPNGASR